MAILQVRTLLFILFYEFLCGKHKRKIPLFIKMVSLDKHFYY